MSSTLRKQLAAVPARRRRERTAAAERLSDRHRRPFPARMAAVAELLGAGLPINCVSVSTDSVFDTHESQAAPFAAGLGEAAQTLYAFQRDLEARGLDNRVLTLVWSEFGRRPQENGSAGTDHGAAGCAFVIGTRAAGTMIGEWAGPAERPGPARQPQRDRRLPLAVLLAPGAVARPRGRPDHPGRRELPARHGRQMRRAAPLAAAVAALALAAGASDSARRHPRCPHRGRSQPPGHARRVPR